MTKSLLRTCLSCHLVFEGDGLCPACHHDPNEPPPPPQDEPAKQERRKTSEVPMLRPKK